MGEVTVIETKEKFTEALASKDVVLVDFFADWCGPCRHIAPKIKELAGEMPNTGFFKVNVDDAEELAGDYGISSLPTFLIFKKGEKVATVIGADITKVKEELGKHV